MKKLALALVCLVSVAFFASCDPTIQNPEPSIAIIEEEGYLTSGQVIDMEVAYPFGFIVASNPDTQKELTKFVIVCGDVTLCDTVISGTEFTYRGEIYFTNNEDSRDIVSYEIKATVTDAAGETNTATIKVDVNEVEEVELVPTEFTWNRHGAAAGTGLEEFGLQWTSNTKEVYANIRPLDGATLYEFDASVWDATTTEAEKAALFSEMTLGIDVFRGVSCNASADYDYVIGTTYNGENHLIHITRAEVHKFKGTDITITGEAK